MAEKKLTLAFSMLQQTKSVADRAISFHESIRRNIQRDVIDKLISDKDELEDKIFKLTDFSLVTDVNKGTSAVTREEAEERFKDLIQAEYDLQLLELEIKAKTDSFNKYFGDVPEQEQPRD